ncbi:hypothetical protein GmRootV35_38330 [Variovorax sp. V35]
MNRMLRSVVQGTRALPFKQKGHRDGWPSDLRASKAAEAAAAGPPQGEPRLPLGGWQITRSEAE